MGEWKELSGNRLIKDMGQYSIIVPRDNSNRIPLDCPVCKQLMSTHEDSISFRDFSCCTECETVWAYQNKSRWQEGWRPSPDAISKELEKRNESPSFIYHVK